MRWTTVVALVALAGAAAWAVEGKERAFKFIKDDQARSRRHPRRPDRQRRRQPGPPSPPSLRSRRGKRERSLIGSSPISFRYRLLLYVRPLALRLQPLPVIASFPGRGSVCSRRVQNRSRLRTLGLPLPGMEQIKGYADATGRRSAGPQSAEIPAVWLTSTGVGRG